MPSTQSTYGNNPDIAGQASDAAAQAKGKANELGNTAAGKIDQNRGSAAGGLESAADSLHQNADKIPGGQKTSDAAHAAAEKLSAGADYVRNNDVNAMVRDAEAMVRKNPGPALLIAAGVGFLLARAFTSDGR